MIPIRRLGWSALAVAALAGCESATTPAPAPANNPAVSPTGPGQNEIKSLPVDPAKPEAGKGAAADAKLSDKEVAEVKKLSAEDQKLAMEQKVCPVSGHNLGSMDAPIKKVIGDRTFFICCASCEDDVKNKPAEVLAKLKK